MIYGLDRLNSLGGQCQSTGLLRRDVNPLINTMLILEDVKDTEVMMVQVKDFGLFTDTHALGWLGPQVIASTTVAVNDEVDGYVELKPIKWLALNGAPVIHMKVRWSKISTGLPTPGSTSALVDAWQAVRVTPSAPLLETLPEQTGENTDTTTNTNSVDVVPMSDQSGSSAAGCYGVPAYSGDPAPPPTMFSNSSSVFHIDPAVIEFGEAQRLSADAAANAGEGRNSSPLPCHCRPRL